MQTIFELKEQAVTDTPLLLFDCVLPDGQTEHWSTHAVSVGEIAYSARVLRHNVFELQASSDQGVDGVPRISLVLANADSHCSEIERATGWKGARLTAGLVFYDLRNAVPLTDRTVIFQGICNPPDEILEATFRITATNRMNLQRLLLPQVRIQRRCPWEFPSDEQQRAEAVDGGASGKYSRYYRCGYSPGVAGGTGALDGSVAFAGCGYTRTDCEARGMFHNFGGIEFVPPAISVRTYGDKSAHTSAVAVNEARYNDFVPMLYGTAWYNTPCRKASEQSRYTGLHSPRPPKCARSCLRKSARKSPEAQTRFPRSCGTSPAPRSPSACSRTRQTPHCRPMLPFRPPPLASSRSGNSASTSRSRRHLPLPRAAARRSGTPTGTAAGSAPAAVTTVAGSC